MGDQEIISFPGGGQLVIRQPLEKLLIISTEEPSAIQSGIAYLNQIKNRDPSAVSLEVHTTYQQVLDIHSETKQLVNMADFPGFFLAINYCINNGISLYASDVQQQQYAQLVETLDQQLSAESRPMKPRDRPSEVIVKEWVEERAKLSRQRAEYTKKKLSELYKQICGSFVHLASENQAELICDLFTS